MKTSPLHMSRNWISPSNWLARLSWAQLYQPHQCKNLEVNSELTHNSTPITNELQPPSSVSPAWLWHNTQLGCRSSRRGAAGVQCSELLVGVCVCECLCLCSAACVLDKAPRLRIHSINIHWQRLHIQSHGEREREGERK